MTLDTRTIRDRIASHAAATGFFDRVSGHEPKNAPGHGITAATWRQRTQALPAQSSLESASAVVTFTGRIYGNMLAEPQDEIDPRQDDAADAWLERLIGDLTLGGAGRNIDVLGETGAPLDLSAGYLEISRSYYRVVDLTIPVIVNDCWEYGV